MLLLLACNDNNLVEVGDNKGDTVDSGSDWAPPVDSAVDTGEVDEDRVPWALLTSPEAGATVEGCDGLTLRGEVGGGDGALTATWYGNGVALWTGAPEADGTTSLTWDAPASTWTWTLEVVDADGDQASDARDITYAPASAGSWDPDPRWERSAMDDRATASSVGACVGDAILLSTTPDAVWDSGTWTPPASAADGAAAGRSWASWDQVGTVDCHLFRLTVSLPACGFDAVRLSSPWFEGVPINDNLYVVVGGTTAWYGGTSYGGASGVGPAEVDYWMAGTIADLDRSLFVEGDNEILVVTEEYASWGGLGYLEASLVE